MLHIVNTLFAFKNCLLFAEAPNEIIILKPSICFYSEFFSLTKSTDCVIYLIKSTINSLKNKAVYEKVIFIDSYDFVKLVIKHSHTFSWPSDTLETNDDHYERYAG